MKVKKCGEYGSFEYRMPSIPEAMIVLGEIGLNSQKLSDAEGLAENELIYTARMLEKMGKFLSKIDLTIEGKKITKYEDILNEFVMMEYLNEVAVEVFDALGGGNKKKSSSKKPQA